MKSGFGRGYYGEGQLANLPARHRGSRWTKWALAAGVVGAGAVIWFMWPRKSEHEGSGAGPGEEVPKSLLPPAPPMEGQTVLPPAQLVSSAQQLSMPCFFPGAEGSVFSHGPEGRGLYGAEPRGFHGSEARGFSHGAEGRGVAHSVVGNGSHGSEDRGFSYGAEGRGFHGSAVRGFSHGAEGRGFSHGAGGRGHMSQQAYEDAVVASALQLQATGARVVLAPHLAHLAHRIA